MAGAASATRPNRASRPGGNSDDTDGPTSSGATGGGGMEVAAYHHRVVEDGQLVGYPAARRRIAVPLVEVEALEATNPDREVRQHGLLRHDAPCDVAALEPTVEPTLL